MEPCRASGPLPTPQMPHGGSSNTVSPSQTHSCPQPRDLSRPWPGWTHHGPQVQPTAPPSFGLSLAGSGSVEGVLEAEVRGQRRRTAGLCPTLGPEPNRRGRAWPSQALAGAGFLAGLQGPPSCFLSRGLSWQRPPRTFLAGTGPGSRKNSRRGKQERDGSSVCVCGVCMRVFKEKKKKRAHSPVQSDPAWEACKPAFLWYPLPVAPSREPPPSPRLPRRLSPSLPSLTFDRRQFLGDKTGAESWGWGRLLPDGRSGGCARLGLKSSCSCLCILPLAAGGRPHPVPRRTAALGPPTLRRWTDRRGRGTLPSQHLKRAQAGPSTTGPSGTTPLGASRAEQKPVIRLPETQNGPRPRRLLPHRGG